MTPTAQAELNRLEDTPKVVRASLYQKELRRRLDAETALAKAADVLWRIGRDICGPDNPTVAEELNAITELARAEYEKARLALAALRSAK